MALVAELSNSFTIARFAGLDTDIRMHDCPHCSAKSIGAWRKVTATPFSPAICGSCGKASFISGWSNFAVVLATEACLWGSIALAILLRSFYGLLALPVGIAAITLLFAQFSPLVAASDSVLETRRKTARRSWAIVVLGTLSLCVLGYVHYAE